jgi:hypothetical protein
MSSAYHPQTDGQTERVNQSVEAYLRCFVQACPSKWSKWLALAEFWYNTNYHSALKKSPFEVLYGHPPCYFGIRGTDACAVPDLEEWLQERQTMTELLRQQLVRVQQRMKLQADKHRTERSFDVGDQVWLKLQPYIQTTVAPRANHKLSFKYFGPFETEDKIGATAFKLKLPSGSKVHPVFHVSLLKKVKGNQTNVSSTLPPENVSMQEPEMILDRRLKNVGKQTIWQVLVKWLGWPAELATREEEDEILPRLGVATACGQAIIQGQGNVTTKMLQKPKRVRKPNVRVNGPEWVRK